jgi:2-oxoglutarate ferredoxin oxidoreductase subunit alpha
MEAEMVKENKKMIINDFSITFSTVNGSGSATANTTIQKAIFKMGIPVAARNIFPSNIQGMPTWFVLRVNKEGFLARRELDDLLIAMNPETIVYDVKKLKNTGVLLIDEKIDPPESARKLIIYTMPVSKILADCEVPSHLEMYLANMVYVGILSNLIDIDLDKNEIALSQHFNGRKNAIEPNMRVIRAAYSWADKNLNKTDPHILEPMARTSEKIMIDGNTAAAVGALFGGLQFSSWYPITPATTLAEGLNEYIPFLRKNTKTNDISCAVVQAEDELAAIGMVVGAGWAGLRAMTSTSGPGLCLMSEFLGLAYFAEVPLVVWDIQRVGPSTGLPTRTSQGDLTFSFFLSHGDKDFIILLPADMNECFEFGWRSLNIAEQIQSPVIVLSDLELGMNIWMAEKFTYPDEPIMRGKILWEEDLEELVNKLGGSWGRYLDVDKDCIPYRTVIGNTHPAAPYFARGTGHNEFSRYSEDPRDWENNLMRLKKKIESAIEMIPAPMIQHNNNSIGVISYGSSHMPSVEMIHIMEAENIPMDYMRIRGIPFSDSVREFISQHQIIFVVENNRDGQMKQLLCMKYPDEANKFKSVARCDGWSLTPEWLSQIVRGKLELEVMK